MNTNKALLGKLEKGLPLNPREREDVTRLPATLLICYLNGFEPASEHLQRARKWIKGQSAEAYSSLKEALRILRKVRYN
jgi:type II secretory pathway component PulM